MGKIFYENEHTVKTKPTLLRKQKYWKLRAVKSAILPPIPVYHVMGKPCTQTSGQKVPEQSLQVPAQQCLTAGGLRGPVPLRARPLNRSASWAGSRGWGFACDYAAVRTRKYSTFLGARASNPQARMRARARSEEPSRSLIEWEVDFWVVHLLVNDTQEMLARFTKAMKLYVEKHIITDGVQTTLLGSPLKELLYYNL